jgi:hypothetical protein
MVWCHYLCSPKGQTSAARKRLRLAQAQLQREHSREWRSLLQALSDRVLTSPCMLLSPVGSGAVVCRNQCCRLPDQVQTVSALVRRVPDPLLSRAGRDAVVYWNGCCRVLERLQSHPGSSAEVRETGAVTHQNVCRRLKDWALRSGELMRTYAGSRVGGLGIDC